MSGNLGKCDHVVLWGKIAGKHGTHPPPPPRNSAFPTPISTLLTYHDQTRKKKGQGNLATCPRFIRDILEPWLWSFKTDPRGGASELAQSTSTLPIPSPDAPDGLRGKGTQCPTIPPAALAPEIIISNWSEARRMTVSGVESGGDGTHIITLTDTHPGDFRTNDEKQCDGNVFVVLSTIRKKSENGKKKPQI